ATGLITMTGGSLTLSKAAAVMAVGNGIGANGTVNQSAGTVTVNASSSSVIDLGRNGSAAGGVGIYNLSGTGVLNVALLRMNTNNGSRINLSGGTSNTTTPTLGAGIVTLS